MGAGILYAREASRMPTSGARRRSVRTANIATRHRYFALHRKCPRSFGFPFGPVLASFSFGTWDG